MPIALTDFERNVMEMLLAGDDPVLSVLREQYRMADAISREETGAGFYVDFSVPAPAPHLAAGKSFELGDVKAEIDGLQYGAGFVLFVRDGALELLEGYSYDEPWPNRVERFRLSYIGGEKRDLSAVRREWT